MACLLEEHEGETDRQGPRVLAIEEVEEACKINSYLVQSAGQQLSAAALPELQLACQLHTCSSWHVRVLQVGRMVQLQVSQAVNSHTVHFLVLLLKVWFDPPCEGRVFVNDFLMSSNSSVSAISSSLAALPRVHVSASRASSCLPASSNHRGDSGRNTCPQRKSTPQHMAASSLGSNVKHFLRLSDCKKQHHFCAASCLEIVSACVGRKASGGHAMIPFQRIASSCPALARDVQGYSSIQPELLTNPVLMIRAKTRATPKTIRHPPTTETQGRPIR